MKIIKSIFNEYLKKTIATQKKLFIFNYKRKYLANCSVSCNEIGISKEKYCDNEIIVSLTTHDKRIHEVYLTIESIMQQTMKPNKIILWISDNFKYSDIPLILRNQEKRGLEIRHCKDIRSYTKLIPSLYSFPDAIIITIDDDIFYHFELIENLFNSYKINQNLIHCTRMHRMKLINNNKIEKYNKWQLKYKNDDISPLNFPTGVGGILYPPYSFSEEVFNENIFLDICKYADDVWFKAMALLNGTMSKYIYNHNNIIGNNISNKNIEGLKLAKLNIKKEMNDVQLKAVFDKYDLYKYLIK